jgi:hypothetical protein
MDSRGFSFLPKPWNVPVTVNPHSSAAAPIPAESFCRLPERLLGNALMMTKKVRRVTDCDDTVQALPERLGRAYKGTGGQHL